MSKALTVKQPWAWGIIHGGKDVENRSRPTKYRGPMYIHAGKAVASEALDFPAMRHALGESMPSMPAGFVIGSVDVIDCHHADDCGKFSKSGACSEWAMDGYYHWVLSSPRPIAPAEATGKLGIWNLELPDEQYCPCCRVTRPCDCGYTP